MTREADGLLLGALIGALLWGLAIAIAAAGCSLCDAS